MSDMEDSNSEMDQEDAHGLVLGQFSNTRLSQTQKKDSQDPDNLLTYQDEISETSDSEAEIVNRMESPPSSTLRSVVTKRSVTTDNKSKNIKNSIHQGLSYIFVNIWQFNIINLFYRPSKYRKGNL